MINSIARNLQQKENIANMHIPLSIARPSEPHINQTASDLQDPMPMNLSRMRLSATERTYRIENGLCIACGEKGLIAKDHRRKMNSIPMSKHQNNKSTPRGEDNCHRFSVTNRNNSLNPRNVPVNNIQPLPMPMTYYPSQFFPQ